MITQLFDQCCARDYSGVCTSVPCAVLIQGVCAVVEHLVALASGNTTSGAAASKFVGEEDGSVCMC